MELFGFGSDVAFTPREELLEGVTVAPLSRSISDGSPFQAAIFAWRPAGASLAIPRAVRRSWPCWRVGRRERRERHRRAIAPGEAVFWAEGEEHETKSAAGLTALIVEGDGLAPFRPTA